MKKKAKKRAPKAPSYWWFDAEVAVALRDQLNAALEGGARLEVRIDAKKSMTLSVVPLGSYVGVGTVAVPTFAPLNKSHYCPPQCS